MEEFISSKSHFFAQILIFNIFFTISEPPTGRPGLRAGESVPHRAESL